MIVDYCKSHRFIPAAIGVVSHHLPTNDENRGMCNHGYFLRELQSRVAFRVPVLYVHMNYGKKK